MAAHSNLVPMEPCHEHPDHHHIHAKGCGHTPVLHDGHLDFIHDGHLHHTHEHHTDCHHVEVTKKHPAGCTPGHSGCHPGDHVHGTCSHPKVPHGDHMDHLVNNHLHHAHEGHCDDHGKLPHA